MALRGMLLHQQLLLLLGLFISAVTEAFQPNTSCERSCGSVSIPYPFGTSKGCYLDESFLITCHHTFETPRPFLSNGDFGEIPLLDISLDGELRVSTSVARDCYTESNVHIHDNDRYSRLNLSKFAISYTKNKLTAVGCDTSVKIKGLHEHNYSSGSTSTCDDMDSVFNGSCSNNGCCQASIPQGVTEFTLMVGSFFNHSMVHDLNPCGFGFVVEEKAYNFSSLDLKNLQNRETVPVVLDWAVGNETCEGAQRNKTSYACKATNSECYNSTNDPGYRCNCSSGFAGNPYLLDGCQDIDECKISNSCIKNCNNFPGGFNCFCPKGYEGDGLRNGTGCRPTVNQSRIIIIALCISVGVLVLLMGGSWIYWCLKRRKLMKLKEIFFQQNGGILLEQQLSNHRGLVETARIFSAEELKKATNNYDKSRVLGQGGYGTVYKGVLPNNKVVAIKKSKIGDQSQIEQFITEIIVLTQIIHKNVVKLLGCCLETEAPLLVYEFVTNGTLSHHIHDKDLSIVLSWEKRLKIAAETAGALSYMHSETIVPIIHRDIKTANILLDDNFTAKVADFGASRLVPLDQKQITTLVQGTFGYLDPEYLHTSQLTEKSDVYSFGVVMAELLTGRMAVCFDMPESERNLAMCFASVVQENHLLQILEDHIVNEGNIEQLKEVVNLAQRCLKVRGEDRPSMKEVATELEGLVIMEKHPSVNTNVHIEENDYLRSAPTESFNIDVGTSSTSTTAGYENMKNELLKSLNYGR